MVVILAAFSFAESLEDRSTDQGTIEVRCIRRIEQSSCEGIPEPLIQMEVQSNVNCARRVGNDEAALDFELDVFIESEFERCP